MSGGGKGGGSQVTGYRYSFGIHMGIGRGPVDELVQIKVDDKVAWSGNVSTNTDVTIDQYNLFGGEGKEGGIQGTLQVMMGEDTQTASSGLLAMLGAPLPGFRRMVTAFFDGIVTMNNPYPKKWKFRQRRALKGWDGAVFQPTLARIIRGEDTSTPGVGSPTPGYVYVPAGAQFVVFQAGGGYVLTQTVTTGFVDTVENIGRMAITARNTHYGSSYTFMGAGIAVDLGDNYIAAWSTQLGPSIGIAQCIYVDLMCYAGSSSPVIGPGSQSVVCTITTPPAYGPNAVVAMNPAHIIYECLTNREWGRGFSSAVLDITSFTTCAQTLYDEGFGLCLKWSRRDTIESFVQSIIDHIGATIFTSRSTALITLRLIRGDYTESALPMFDVESGILDITESTISAPGSGINLVEVTYHDPLTDEDKVVKVDNLAAIQAAGGNISSAQKDYPGIPWPDLALRVAQRDLRAGSLALRRFSIIMDRRGRQIEPGSVIRIRDANRGIPDTVVRVGHVDDGTLTSGKITITGIQDVFALPTVSFSADVPNTWEPANVTPCLDIHRAFEIPYFLIAHNTSPADMAYIDAAAGYIGTVVAQGQSMNVGYKIAVRDSAPTSEDFPVGTDNYCGFVPDWTP